MPRKISISARSGWISRAWKIASARSGIIWRIFRRRALWRSGPARAWSGSIPMSTAPARSRRLHGNGRCGRKAVPRRRIDAMHIVHTEASCGWGGQEIRILTEAEGMLRRGHKVTLLCPPEARIFAEAQQRKIPVVALPIGRKRLPGVLALRRWLKANSTDVINTHSSTDTWLAALASRLLDRPPPLVRPRHISAPVPKNRLTRWLYQRASTHIVTTGEKLRLQLILENGYDPARIPSVPTGMDTGDF